MFTSVCANIRIDGSALPASFAYEALVNLQVQEIFAKRTGYWVLWQIAHLGMRSGKTLLIAPFTPEQWAKYPRDTFPSPDIHFDDDHAADARTSLLSKRRIKGPGVGSNGLIHYNPGEYKALVVDDVQRRGLPYVGTTLDEALFHEMLHALRGMQGLRCHVPTTGGSEIQDYLTVEEFFAVLITNIYMAEKGQTQLRRNERGLDPLPESLNTSAKFLCDKDNVRWINYLWRQEADLFDKIASIVTFTDFNPIRELAANRAKYDVN